MVVVGCVGGRGAGAEATGAVLWRRLLRRRLLLLLRELVAERSCDELAIVALRRRELASVRSSLHLL